MSTFKDFVGINICIYDPSGTDIGAIGENTFGYTGQNLFMLGTPSYNNNAGKFNVSRLTYNPPAKTLTLLNLHRNGPYGYPMWKQTRASQNAIMRNHRLTNTFTYVQQPGPIVDDFKRAKYGDIISLTEPVVSHNSPISVVGEISVYNDELGIFENKPVELKTSFDNEIVFFVNDKANQNFNTIFETDENYESLKSMYLDGGLDDEGSLLDAFALFTYRQTVWPQRQYSFLDNTRSRNFYVNTFWRDNREDRAELNITNQFDIRIPSQSIWPLDAPVDFATRTKPLTSSFSFNVGAATINVTSINHRIGGSSSSLGTNQNNSSDGAGILQNSYSHVYNGAYLATGSTTVKGLPINAGAKSEARLQDDSEHAISASILYARKHTIKSVLSNYNLSFPTFNTGSAGRRYLSELEGANFSNLTLDGSASLMPTSSLFGGEASWDAPSQAGKGPFYDSYDDYALEIKNKGKDYSIIPEFRISSHVETYQFKGVTEELQEIFELSGAFSKNTTTKDHTTFYKVLSNSDFLKHFDLIKKDHKGFASEKILTLRCKAIKKFLPYDGFYPAQRTVDLAKQFASSYKNFIHGRLNRSATILTGSLAITPVMEPLFAPGILFNTIKSGVAVDFPIFTPDDFPRVVSSSNNNNNEDWVATGGDPAMSPSGPYQNFYWGGTNRNQSFNDTQSAFSSRIPFEALVEPEAYIANLEMIIQEPHPFGIPYTGSLHTHTSSFPMISTWNGSGDQLYKKMANNLLAEIPEFFISEKNMKTIASLEEQSSKFGNAVSGNYYAMRIKMRRSRTKDNDPIIGFYQELVTTPQDLVTFGDRNSGTSLTGTAGAIKARFSTKESLTMYSRPSAFGPPTYGGNGWGQYRGINFRECGSYWGTNYPYTPPYYHGEAWCDLIFHAKETKKYTLDEILSSSQEYPYFTRFWWNGTMDALRDLTGYSGSNFTGSYGRYQDGPWHNLIKGNGGSIATYTALNVLTGSYNLGKNAAEWGSATIKSGSTNIGSISGTLSNPSTPTLKWLSRPIGTAVNPQSRYLIQHPYWLNYNAMQLDSSVNIFGKGTVREIFNKETGEFSEVASADTIRGKTRWIIQPKFETPILNFKKYENLTANGGTLPLYTSESVPRGMWHQYGDIPSNSEVGVFLQIEDLPKTWAKGALGLKGTQKNLGSLADLVGFSKEPVRLGEVAPAKEVSEAVVAVPFIEKGGTRKFFSIPRNDIDSSIDAARREIGGQFPAGGPPKAGDTVYQMVKNMQKYVFPPSMDFVRYEEIDPFAMYIFEFKHTFSKQDLADMWQNLPPEIGRSFEEAEASISHELLSAELLGDGAVVKGDTLDENAEGKGVPSNIQWMIFKVKKRAKTNYFEKVIAKKGTTSDTSESKLQGVTRAPTGKLDKEITYNWPYDFFSLVELVKIDAEISFANIENDDKGQKSIKKVESKRTRNPSMISKARGKGKIE